MIQEDHTTSKCKAIKSIVNPLYKVYNTENGASLQKLSDESQISGKSQRILLLEIEKKESKTPNTSRARAVSYRKCLLGN